MGYKYVGSKSITFVTSSIRHTQLNPGDWIDPDDVLYMLDKHSNDVQEFPGEGPSSINLGDYVMGPTGPTGPDGPTGPTGP